MGRSKVTFQIDTWSTGLNVDNITGLPVAIGTCSAGVAGQVTPVGPESDLDTQIGVGPLRDFLEDHFTECHEGNALNPYVLAVPVTKNDTGTVGTPDTSGVTGLAVATFGSACDMDAEVWVKCVKAGAAGTAQVSISLDGGITYEKTVTPAEATDIGLPDCGLALSFSFVGGDMALNDIWKVSLTAPAALLTDIMTIVDGLDEVGYWPEYIAIAMSTDSTDWATIHAKAASLLGTKAAAWFLCRTDDPSSTASADLTTWVNSLVSDASGFSSNWLSVCAGYGRVAEKNGRKRWRNLIGKASGMIARAQVNESVGWRGKNNMPDVHLPDDWTNAMASTLIDARYMALVRRPKPRACAFNHAPTMADETSKFGRLESVRVTFKAIRLAEKAVEPYIESPAWEEAGQQGKVGMERIGIASIKTKIEAALQTMTTAQPLSELDRYQVQVPGDQSPAGTGGVYYKLLLYGIPNIAGITIGVAFDFAKWTIELLEVE